MKAHHKVRGIRGGRSPVKFSCMAETWEEARQLFIAANPGSYDRITFQRATPCEPGPSGHDRPAFVQMEFVQGRWVPYPLIRPEPEVRKPQFKTKPVSCSPLALGPL